MKKYLIISLLAAACYGALVGCQKEQSSPVLRIRLTDAPTALDEVNIDLKQVTLKMKGAEEKWVSLKTNAGIYNLLALQNGIETMIAEGAVGQGTVQEIRLVLGNNNSVVANGTTFPLTIPSGAESGLKIKLSKEMRQPLESLLIDFDAALSVKKENNGYKLRPVLRLK